MDNKKLVTALLFILTVGLAGYAARNSGTGLPLLVAAGGTLFFICNPRVMLMVLVCVGVSGLRLPGLGGRLSLESAIFALVTGYGIIRAAMIRDRRTVDLCDRGLLVFSLALLLVIAVGGFGMAMFGGNAYGGKDYIVIFIFMAGYKAVQNITLNARQARMLIYCFLAAAAVPVIAQMCVYFSPSLYSVLDRIIDTKAGYIGDQSFSGETFSVNKEVRLSSAGGAATALWFVAMARYGLIPQKRKMLYAAFGVAVLLVLLGGFRGATTARIFTSFVALVVVSRSRLNTVIALVGLALVGYLLLFIIGPQLPFAIQRSFSFLPGIDWDFKMLAGAANSVDWRVEVWKLCWQRVPQHLLIGRGLLIENVAEHAWLSASYYGTPEFFYAAHGYHSGPLALLLDTGLLGLLGFAMFQIGLIRKAFGYFRATAGSSNLFLRGYMLGQVITTSFAIFSYYFIFGDIKETLPKMLVAGILIRIVGEALLKEKAESAVAAEAVGEAEVKRQVSGVRRRPSEISLR